MPSDDNEGTLAGAATAASLLSPLNNNSSSVNLSQNLARME